jgi:HSP20 family molecular chaperone IbpA
MAMTLVKSNRFLEPFRDLFDDDVNDWFVGFDHAVQRWTDQWDRVFHDFQDSPKTHVEQLSDHEYKIRMDLPGWDKKELHLKMVGDELVITGEHAEEDKAGKERSEKRQSFHQRFYLSDGMNVEYAKFENGRLTVDLRCPPPPKPAERMITIN